MTIDALPQQQALLDAAQQLTDEYAGRLPSGHVIASLGRAKVHVQEGLRAVRLPLPPPDEYAALVIGLARQELDLRLKPPPAARANRPVRTADHRSPG